MIDSDPLTRSYITRTRGFSFSLSLFLPFVHRPCSLPPALSRPSPVPSAAPHTPNPPFPFHPPESRARRLSGVRSTNKSNTPRFVPRESSSFTIHEFIMGTTEDTTGPPLLIYRYAYPASRTGTDLHEQRNARSWWGLGSRTLCEICCVR